MNRKDVICSIVGYTGVAVILLAEIAGIVAELLG